MTLLRRAPCRCGTVSLQAVPGSGGSVDYAVARRAPPCAVASHSVRKPLMTSNPKIPDLLAQGVTVKAQQLCRPDLVAAGGGKADGNQRPLDLLHNSVIDAGRRQAIALCLRNTGSDTAPRRRPGIGGPSPESAAKVLAGSFSSALTAAAEIVSPDCSTARRRIKILQLAHIARPAMAAQQVERLIVERLVGQALVLRLAQEMAHQIGNVLDALAQAAAGAAARHSAGNRDPRGTGPG